MSSLDPTKMTYRQRLWTVGALALVGFIAVRLWRGDSAGEIVVMLGVLAVIVFLMIWVDAGRRA